MLFSVLMEWRGVSPTKNNLSTCVSPGTRAGVLGSKAAFRASGQASTGEGMRQAGELASHLLFRGGWSPFWVGRVPPE